MRLLRGSIGLLMVLVLSLCAVSSMAGEKQEFEPQSGEKLVQCVTILWEVPKDQPVVKTTIMVFGKVAAERTLQDGHQTLPFDFKDRDIKAKGSVSMTFDAFKGIGYLYLDDLKYSCDWTGEFESEGRIASFSFTPKFEY